MHVDNVVAIFLSGNASVSQQTKHIGVINNFIRDYIEEGHIKIKLVCSE